MTYSIFKRLLPRPVRTFLRDLDSAYHKLERDLDAKNQQIQELLVTYQKLQTFHQELQTSHQELQSSQQELQTSHQELESSHQKLQTSHQELQSSHQKLQTFYQQLQESFPQNLDSHLQYHFTNLRRALFREDTPKICNNIDYTKLHNVLPNTGCIPLQQKFSSAKEIVETFLYADKRSQNIEGLEGFAPDDAIFDPETQSYELWSNVGLAGIVTSFGYANYSNTSILELGCGPAHLLFFFNRYGIDNYLGIDGHPYFIDFNPYLNSCKDKFRVFNLQQEIKLCVEQKAFKFDIILCFEVLEHIREDMIDNIIRTIHNHMHSKSVVFCTSSLQVFDVHVLVRKRDWWIERFARFGLYPREDEAYLSQLLGSNHPFNWSPDNTNIFALSIRS